MNREQVVVGGNTMGREERANRAEQQATVDKLRADDKRIGQALPFDSVKLCPKCGYEPMPLNQRPPFARRYVPADTWPVEPREHLLVTCPCQFTWREECRDADGGRVKLEVVGAVGKP